MLDLRAWLGRLRSRAPVVPVVRLNGVIGGSSLRGGGLSLDSLNPSLERAFKLRGAKAVALAINSPGGSPVQSALIAGRIRALAGEKKLPVIAFVEDVGASGGYWLALAADEIFADPSSIVGSIGVINAGFGFVEALERLGIERRVYTAGAKKALLDPFRPADPDDVERLHGILQELHQGFKATVRERRGERLKGDDSELFEGQIWTGNGALEAGLIDGLGALHGVLKERYGDKVRLPVISTAKPWWQRRLGVDAPRALVDAALDSLAERELWSRYGR
jgi:serine protease SohB